MRGKINSLVYQILQKELWQKKNRIRDFERIKWNIAVRLVLSLDIEEVVDLLKEKLPLYEFPKSRVKTLMSLIEKIKFNYQFENIDFQRANHLLRRLGIPEPYVLLAEFLLRDNGISP